MTRYAEPTGDTGAFYNAIGVAAVGLVGRKYHRILVNAVVHDPEWPRDVALIVFYSQREGAEAGSIPIEADTGRLIDAISALQDHLTQTGQAPWTRLDYVLTGSKMSVELFYRDQFDPEQWDVMEASRALKTLYFPMGKPPGLIGRLFGR